jgi:ferredoxin like protein
MSASETKTKRMKIEDKLYLTRFEPDEEEKHIKVISEAVCDRCVEKPCTYICPAEVYRMDEDGKLAAIACEGCLECGSCRIACPYQNLEWEYPRGGFGIMLKYG